MSTRTDFLDTARAAATLLRDPALVRAWDGPSALAEFPVSGLAGHLAFQVLALPQILASPIPPEPAVPILEHYARVEWIGADLDHEFNVNIRKGGGQIAEVGPQGLAAQLDEAILELTEQLAIVPERPVRLPFWGPWALILEDMLLTRMMELIVHGDDLAVSLDVPTPEFPARAVDAVVELLGKLAVRRHGATAVIRGLSRAERAPANITAF